MPPVRRGGHARNALGQLLTWSEAEGERGTRWREALAHDGRLLRSVMLETSREGRPVRLEMTTAAGLLTLHPEPDQSAIHGNVVTPDGVRHLAFAWSTEHDLFLQASPASATVAVRRLAPRLSVGSTVPLETLRIDDDLVPRPVRWQVTRLAPDAWHLRDTESAEERLFTVTDHGRPILLDEHSWPLET